MTEAQTRLEKILEAALDYANSVESTEPSKAHDIRQLVAASRVDFAKLEAAVVELNGTEIFCALPVAVESCPE